MKDDTISRAAAIKPLMAVKAVNPSIARCVGVDWCIDEIKALPPAQPDVSDTNVGKMCEYYDLCRNGRDEKKLREELLSAQPECEDCIKHGGNICPPCPKVPECEDAVSRAAVINAWRDACNSVMSKCACHYDDDIKDTVYDNTSEVNAVLRCNKEFKNALKALPLITPKQPGWTTDVNDILAYLDGVVHPLVSPENWNVYSELYDMVSGLLKSCEGEQE